MNQESASLYHAEYRKIQPHNKVKGIFKVSLKNAINIQSYMDTREKTKPEYGNLANSHSKLLEFPEDFH